MKLRTRIILLFLAVVTLTTLLVVSSFMIQSLIFNHLESSLLSIKQYLHEPNHFNPDKPHYYVATASYYLDQVFTDFSSYRSNTYIQMIISVTFVMIVFAIVMDSLKKHVTSRLDLMGAFVKDIYNQGLTHKRLDVVGRDELSRVMKLLNSTFNMLESKSAEAEGRRLEQRKILLTLIHQSKGKVAYFRLNGHLVGSNLDSDEESRVSEVVGSHLDRLQDLALTTETIGFHGDQVLAISHASMNSGAKLLYKVEITQEFAQQKL
ncbi:MAG: hypothetical protein OXC40_05825 [Proteobacteria bacterium]|nr:hypothetical protein [Pseudomonadota bacterium]